MTFVVIVKRLNDDVVFGPFANETNAHDWGRVMVHDKDWYLEPIIDPTEWREYLG